MSPDRLASLSTRFDAFVLERHPFAAPTARKAFGAALTAGPVGGPADLELLRARLRQALADHLAGLASDPAAELTPGVSAATRVAEALADLQDACDGFLRREAIALSLTPDERRDILRGMILTRAIDNRLKTFFARGEIKYGTASFQGKGFRSLGQEAIYASAIRLRRGSAWRSAEGEWQGDVISPMIRDLGAVVAMRPGPETVRMVLSAQMGKAGPPMDGRDLHIGDFTWGIYPPAAPLLVPTLSMAGMGLAFAQTRSGRVAVSYLGDGATSLGEWHEAINLCAVRRLPVIFCVQNNQTALSTPVSDQTAARVFADKAIGYGIPGITIDGTDPDEIAVAFAWAAERARDGCGPALIELVCMRMCGHAHHDDMLYHGRDVPPSWEYPALTGGGYADAGQYAFWSGRDPIARYAGRLLDEGIIDADAVAHFKHDAEAIVETEAQAVIAAPWPDPAGARAGVVDGQDARPRMEVLTAEARQAVRSGCRLPPTEPGPPFDPKGQTLLEGVMRGIEDALCADPRVFVFGEDVGGKYGNAFLMLRPLLKTYGDRIINAPIAESAIIGAAVGAALAGLRPIAEMQFNDFVATGFNQLVNNAAKNRYRFGQSVPMVLRMPWGGLRHAGPYHSQNTEAWFYRTPGLKIVVPSTPHDARALLASAVADPDPVLYYEHIALYRDPSIKQVLGETAPAPIPLGKAAIRRAGSDLAIISYGAYVHVAMRVANTLAGEGIEATVVDLRSLAPLDRETLISVACHCGRVLIVHEDTRTGGIGESLAAIVQEEAFEALDAPIRVIGALDTPVPYSPTLEEAFLPGEAEIARAARLLVKY
ncbi:MAG: thiamine pyrophosphate-dependent enzyme [Acidobacteria bacterium]|nr:thiamine pyrophosphate-dependent enzyme [Acidobacteriota bacterium]